MLKVKTWVRIMAIASFVAVGAADPARADQVFNFDDLTPVTSGLDALTGLPVPSDYGGHGLVWTNFNYVTPSVFSGVPSGYQNVDASHGNVAINLGGDASSLTISGAELFTFNSVDLKAAWNDGMTVTMVGSLGGTQEFSTAATVGTSAWNGFANAFAGTAVDSLTFTATGGTHHDGFGGDGSIFIMDNLALGFASVGDSSPAIGAVPEPSSLISAAAAVAVGLGFGARRRRRSA